MSITLRNLSNDKRKRRLSNNALFYCLLNVEKCDRFDAGGRRRRGVPQSQSANQLKALQFNEVSRSKDVGVVPREMGSESLLQYFGALP